MVLYYILLPLAWIVFHVGFRVRAEGRDNLKKIRTRGYILAPNHISAIDPVFVIITQRVPELVLPLCGRALRPRH